MLFTSDNGPWLKRPNAGSALPLRDGKSTLYEGGFRVPAIFWGSAYAHEGGVYGGIASTLDLLPTFAALAGAEIPADLRLDGRDISAVLADPGRTSPNPAFFYFDNSATLRGVRDGDWKYLEDRDARGDLKSAELYDLATDISEKTNLADENPSQAASMLAILREFGETLDPFVSVQRESTMSDAADGTVELHDLADKCWPRRVSHRFPGDRGRCTAGRLFIPTDHGRGRHHPCR